MGYGKPSIIVNCEQCGKEVKKYQSQIKPGQMYFCSFNCQHIWRTGRTGTIKKPKGILKKCLYCEKDFYVYPSEVDIKKYCSKECRIKHNVEKGTWSGENCNFWRGGFDYYRGPNWHEQKRKARKRDKVCQKCGKTREENIRALNVHHIIPFRFFNGNYIEANSLDNLITLCSSCHRETDSHWWNNVPEHLKDKVNLPPAEKILLNQWNKYSEEEIQKIIELYPTHSAKQLADIIQRPYSSIRWKIVNLGLKK